MALGLNSTLSIAEGKNKLPPCPILLLSNSDGLLQVYYFIHTTLPSICRPPEVIKPSEVSLPLAPHCIQLSSQLFSSSSTQPPCKLFIRFFFSRSCRLIRTRERLFVALSLLVSYGCRENNNNNLLDVHDHH